MYNINIITLNKCQLAVICDIQLHVRHILLYKAVRQCIQFN